ncbi:MAG: pilus assembly protein PilM [bacterium]|nr:pilus assembly protein PilM [bacterium]
MASKTNNISILQFDENRITLLRVRRGGRGIDVVSFESTAGSWSTADGSLAHALKGFAAQHHIAGDTICTVLPRHDMTARILTLPSHDPGEVAGMVRHSAEEYVPYPVSDLVIDQCILHKLPDGSARVLAVFAHHDLVETHVATMRKAGLEPEGIYVSSACLASAAVEALKEHEERYALVNIASGGVEVMGLHGHRLEYGRAVGMVHASTSASLGPAAYDELAAEVRASLSAYQRESEDGSGAEGICVCSEWADVSSACETLASETGLECVPADFTKTLMTRGGDAVTTTPLALLGAALAAQGRAAIRISLVPDSLVRERAKTRTRRTAIQAGALAITLAIALAALYGQAVYQRNVRARELQTRIESVRPLADNVESKMRRLARLQEHVDRSGSAVELLARLCLLMPESGMNISRLSFSHGQGITVEGRAMSQGDVSLLTEDLREVGQETVPQFRRAVEGRWTLENERGQEVIHYSIRIPFPKSEGDESDRSPSEADEYEYEE